MWDPRALASPLSTLTLDTEAGALFPLYDDSTGLYFLVGKGDTSIRALEISAAGALDRVSDFASSSPVAGLCLLPKQMCEVREVEVSRLLKLTTDSVIPISFKVPRAENLKQYFQDDLFPPVRRRSSACKVHDWMNQAPCVPEFESLCPNDMTPLSSKPPEEVIKKVVGVVDYKSRHEKEQKEHKEKEETFSRMQVSL